MLVSTHVYIYLKAFFLIKTNAHFVAIHHSCFQFRWKRPWNGRNKWSEDDVNVVKILLAILNQQETYHCITVDMGSSETTRETPYFEKYAEDIVQSTNNISRRHYNDY